MSERRETLLRFGELRFTTVWLEGQIPGWTPDEKRKREEDRESSPRCNCQLETESLIYVESELFPIIRSRIKVDKLPIDRISFVYFLDTLGSLSPRQMSVYPRESAKR